MMRVEDLLRASIETLHNSETPRLDAEWIFMEVLAWNHSRLISDSQQNLEDSQIQKIADLIERRRQGEPVAYILGYWEFYKYRFIVNKNVLVPRPDTELVVSEALNYLGLQKKEASIADLGCGSGCIGLSLLKELPQARLWACDASSAAMQVFKQNALALGLMDRVKYSISDVTENIVENEYDIVVSNPPYIDQNDTRLAADVKKFEPARALFAGDHGLEFYKKWLPWSYKALHSKGAIVFECGDGQAQDVRAIAIRSGFVRADVKKDLSGKERVVTAVKE